MKDYACERIYRDARITSIYEGTTQLQVVAAIRHVTTGTYASLLESVLFHLGTLFRCELAFACDVLIHLIEVDVACAFVQKAAVVAAIRHVTTGTYASLLESYAAKGFSGNLAPIADRLAELTKSYRCSRRHSGCSIHCRDLWR